MVSLHPFTRFPLDKVPKEHGGRNPCGIAGITVPLTLLPGKLPVGRSAEEMTKNKSTGRWLPRDEVSLSGPRRPGGGRRLLAGELPCRLTRRIARRRHCAASGCDIIDSRESRRAENGMNNLQSLVGTKGDPVRAGADEGPGKELWLKCRTIEKKSENRWTGRGAADEIEKEKERAGRDRHRGAEAKGRYEVRRGFPPSTRPTATAILRRAPPTFCRIHRKLSNGLGTRVFHPLLYLSGGEYNIGVHAADPGRSRVLFHPPLRSGVSVHITNCTN